MTYKTHRRKGSDYASCAIDDGYMLISHPRDDRYVLYHSQIHRVLVVYYAACVEHDMRNYLATVASSLGVSYVHWYIRRTSTLYSINLTRKGKLTY